MVKRIKVVLIIFICFVFVIFCISRISVSEDASISIKNTATDSPATVILSQMSNEPESTVTLIDTQYSESKIRSLLQDSTDCQAPCFFGIVPNVTKLDEAKLIFENLNLQKGVVTKNSYNVTFGPKNGIYFSIILQIKEEIVQSIFFELTPDSNAENSNYKWKSYSPDTLISQYGNPSSIDFTVSTVETNQNYSMIFSYSSINLIAQYSGNGFSAGSEGTIKICPLLGQINDIRLWFGEAPKTPPNYGIPLSSATNYSEDEFVSLILSPKTEACFLLKNAAFK